MLIRRGWWDAYVEIWRVVSHNGCKSGKMEESKVMITGVWSELYCRAGAIHVVALAVVIEKSLEDSRMSSIIEGRREDE